MKRPGIASTIWFIAFVAVSILLFRHFPWTSAEGPDHRSTSSGSEDMIFGIKGFYDSAETAIGDGFVTIKGTLAGDGVGYKNNSINVACHKDRGECLVSSIEQISSNQLSSLNGPSIYPITKWDAYEVIATGSGDAMDCRKVTINLERKTQTAAWVEEPINQSRAACKDADTKIYKWTIEDPPFWKALHK
jgi:hypothetical protein